MSPRASDARSASVATGRDHHHQATRRRRTTIGIAMAVSSVLVLGLSAGAVQARVFGDWTTAQRIDLIDGNSTELNTIYLDGCPILSPDGLSLYMASTRPRYEGDTRTDLDIWVAHRPSTSAPFNAPVNLGEPINSAFDDFCPTPVRGKGLYFVSRRPGGCGLGDIYFTRDNPAHGWTAPVHLACAPVGPNSTLDEQGPSYVEEGGTPVLYFSRSTIPPGNSGELFVSRSSNGSFGPASPIAELNDPTAHDIQPNVRKDGRELVFTSNRAGSNGGSLDIWVSTRASTGHPWTAPVNLGPAINTAVNESRPSLSWDGRTLLFGRAVPGRNSDIHVSTRE